MLFYSFNEVVRIRASIEEPLPIDNKAFHPATFDDMFGILFLSGILLSLSGSLFLLEKLVHLHKLQLALFSRMH